MPAPGSGLGARLGARLGAWLPGAWPADPLLALSGERLLQGGGGALRYAALGPPAALVAPPLMVKAVVDSFAVGDPSLRASLASDLRRGRVIG